MARKKEYIESEVIDKAMELFWKNGYETTSMQMLEKQMGINKFSIYSSFGSKKGVFLECVKSYRKKLLAITDKLKDSKNGIEGIKQYFYDFLEFAKDNNDFIKGCLVTNAANELNENSDLIIKNQLSNFTKEIRGLFENNVRQEAGFSEIQIQEQSDYFIVSMFGLSSASRVFNKPQLHIFIENIFSNT